MPDLTEVLLQLADPPLAAPEPLDTLEGRLRARRRQRRMVRSAVAATCAVVIGLPAFGLLAGQDERPVQVETSQTTVATLPPTPARPSSRLVPTWLPGDLRIVTEEERQVHLDAGTGSTRSYTRNLRTGESDLLLLSLQTGAAPLDVEAELARYAGARRIEVQGRPGLFLPVVRGRGDAVVAWSPAPGQLAQVAGSGLSEDELSTIAQGFVPTLDPTPVPEAFRANGPLGRGSLPPPVPRRYEIGTAHLRGPAAYPASGRPAVRVLAIWNDPLPPGSPETVRGRPAVLSTNGADTSLSWFERPGLLVTVTGAALGVDDVRRVAAGLREQSHEEVLARASVRTVTVARGQLSGVPYELRVVGGDSGPCVELVMRTAARSCSPHLTGTLADLPITISEGPVAFGAVVREATRVRLELAGGRTVETADIGVADEQGAVLYVAALPPDFGRVVAVVALGPNGQVLRRTPVG